MRPSQRPGTPLFSRRSGRVHRETTPLPFSSLGTGGGPSLQHIAQAHQLLRLALLDLAAHERLEEPAQAEHADRPGSGHFRVPGIHRSHLPATVPGERARQSAEPDRALGLDLRDLDRERHGPPLLRNGPSARMPTRTPPPSTGRVELTPIHDGQAVTSIRCLNTSGSGRAIVMAVLY